MKRILYLSVFVIFGFTATFANPKDSIFVKGIIFTAEKNITCFIKSKESYQGKIKYKLDYKARKKQKIHSDNVSQIQSRGRYFDKIKIGKKQFLMQRISKGAISLYKREEEEDGASIYNVSTGTSINIGSQSKCTYYVLTDTEVIKVETKTFHEKVPVLFATEQELQEKVKDLKVKDKDFVKHLSAIINAYNEGFKEDE